MSVLLRRLLSIGYLLCATAAASAQETWTSIPSPTTENLWGVCYGGGQFVAVGGGGTILTSPDGTAWIARTSGTTQWLLSIAYGGGLYVAVGDHGTVLTSPDAITWTDHSIGGPRLNGVAYRTITPSQLGQIGGPIGPWFAVGESATLICAGDTAADWTASVGRHMWIGPTDVSWLRGIAIGGDTLFFSGGGGIVGRASTRSSWQVTSTSKLSTQNIEGTAWSDEGAVFVGEGGLIQIWTFPSPAVVAHDAPDAYFRGVSTVGNAIIAVGERGVICASPGTLDVSVHRVVSPTTANLNAIAASPEVAIATGDHGAIARSLLQHRPPIVIRPFPDHYDARPESGASLVPIFGGSTPLTYEWRRDGALIPGAVDRVLDISKADIGYTGSVYTVTASNALGRASMSTTVRLAYAAPSGRVDEHFGYSYLDLISAMEPLPGGRVLMATDLPGSIRLDEYPVRSGSFSAEFISDGSVTRVISTSGGKIVVLGNFTQLSGTPALGAARINPDGTLDSTFASAGIPKDAISMADGRFIALTLGNSSLTLKRFTAAGAVDATYAEVTLPLPPATDFLAPGRTYSSFVSSRAPDGKIVIAAVNYADLVGTTYAGANESVLLRLQTDGTPDSTFSVVRVTDRINQLVNTGAWLYYGTYDDDYTQGLELRQKFRRLTADGAPDPSYPGLLFAQGLLPSSPIGNISVPVTLTADGGVLALQARAILRFDPEGKRDRTYSAHLDTLVNFAHKLIPLSDGSVLVQGQFTQVNGIPAAGLARIIPRADEYATRLVNLSVRSSAGTGEDTLIAGFVVAGTQGSRSVLARGVGPGLVPYDIPASAVLPDPTLALYRGSDLLASNEDWPSSLLPTVNAVGAFALMSGSKDAALTATIGPANYTAHIAGHETQTGIALAEIYDATPMPASPVAARLMNVSGRAALRRPDHVLIAGFAIAGSLNKRVLIRAVGPSLKDQGVSTPLVDPHLTIYKGQQALADNDDWNTDDTPAFDEVGAFHVAVGSKDAALVIDLPPGAYTGVASSGDGTPGVVLVEVYEMP